MKEQFYSLEADHRIVLVREASEAERPLMIRRAENEPNFGAESRHRTTVAEICSLLGVLEYICDPHELVPPPRGKSPLLIETFNVRREDKSTEGYFADGWVNHFTRDEHLLLFTDHAHALSREHLFTGRGRREYLFDLRRVRV